MTERAPVSAPRFPAEEANGALLSCRHLGSENEVIPEDSQAVVKNAAVWRGINCLSHGDSRAVKMARRDVWSSERACGALTLSASLKATHRGASKHTLTFTLAE